MSDKRTQIIEASIDLFANSGFWNTPTSKITKHAKVSTGTLFNYFTSKDALIDEVYLQLKQEQATHIAAGYPADGSVKERSEHLWFRYIDWGIHFPVRYRLLKQLKLSDLISETARQQSMSEWGFSSSLLPDGVATGVFRDIPTELIGMLCFAQLESAVNYATAHHLADMSLTKHIARTFEIFWAGVTS
jgi:AcrR family transcriptional regulator